VKTITKEENKNYEFNTRLGSYVWSFNNGKNIPYSIAEVREFLYDPIRWNKEIRDLCWWAYNSNGVITNVVDYMCALPTLDRIVFTKDKKKQTFENKRKLFLFVLDEIRDKEIVRDCILKCCNDGIAIYYFMDEELPDLPRKMSNYQVAGLTELNARNNGTYFLKALPVDYCKVVGLKGGSYQVAFDMSYFRQMVATGQMFKLKAYPKEIRDGVREYMKGNPTTNQWLVLDNSKTIVCKVRSKQEEPWGRPIALAALEDILYRDYYIETKRNTLDEINNRLIWQEFPEGKEKGTSSLTSDQQREQHETVKQALNNRQLGKWSVALVSLASGSQLHVLDVNTEILKQLLEPVLFDNIASDVGFAASLLNGTSSGTYSSQENNIKLVFSRIYSWITQFQTELNKVINANVIQDNTCYLEAFYLPLNQSNRDAMIGHYKDLYALGKGSLSAWINSVGIPAEAYIALMESELLDDWENRFPPHQTSFTLSAGGRPAQPDSTNGNTVITRTANGNEIPSPSD